MANSKLDGNYVRSLLAVSSDDGETPVPLKANPLTGALLIDGPSLYTSLDDRYYTETEVDTLLSGKADTSHTHTASDVTDFDTEVSNNTDVAANTTHRSQTDNPHSVTAAQVGNTTAQWNADQAQGAALPTPGAGNDGEILSYNHSSGEYEFVTNAAGETNTASNVGTAGVGVFKQKTSQDLEFKKINAGSSKISITDDTGNDEIDVDVVEANLTLDNIGGTLSISKGGTGAASASAARTALGLAIGSDVQAYDAELAAIAGLTSAADRVPYFTGSGAASLATLTSFGRSLIDDASASAARTTLGVAIGSQVQAYDAGLASIAGLTTAADRMIYTTASDTYAVATLTSFARSILDDADEATFKATVNLEIGTDVQAYDANLDSINQDLGTTDSPTFAGLTVGSLTGVLRADSGVVSTDSDVTDLVSAASDSAAGKVELATIAETSTGTDTGRAVTPDGLAGSVHGEVVIEMMVVEWSTDLSTGDGKFYFHVDSKLNGMNLVRVHAEVITAGTTGTTDVQIHNVTDAVDMLSTKLTIDSGETGSDTAATAAVINTSNDDVATNDLLRVDIDAVSTTAPKGLLVTMVFQLP